MTQWLNQDKAKVESVSNYPKNKILQLPKKQKEFQGISFPFHSVITKNFF